MKRKKTAGQPLPLQTRAAIYIRVSTKDQVDGYGLDVQRERCNAQAVAKGWQVVAEYADKAISGTKDETERPGLASLLDAVKSGEVNVVIVLALDRLARRTSLVLSLVEKLTDAGAALVSCKESLDTTTPQGNFVLTMFAALAQLERDTIVERTTDGRNQRSKRDGEKGGRVPMGYIRQIDGTMMIDADRAKLVQRIFAERYAGFTLQAIADRLDAEGLQTARGGRWYASCVREILLNEKDYRGGQRGESHVCWPPILMDCGAGRSD